MSAPAKSLNTFFINMLSVIFPGIAARLAYFGWTRTYPQKSHRRELQINQQAEKSEFLLNQQKIKLYRWGSGPKILFLHGWNGRATQFPALIHALVDSGYQVVAFDQPGFGESASQRSSGLKTISEAVSVLLLKEKEFAAVIGHSFGWLVAINVLAKKPFAKKLVGVAAPGDFDWLVEAYTQWMGYWPSTLRAMKKHICKIYGINDLSEISITELGSKLPEQGLMIYDDSDNKIPLNQFKNTESYWQNCKVLRTHGLGHTKILHDESSIYAITQFIKSNESANH